MSAQRRMARSGARDEQGDGVWAKGLFLSGVLCESQDVEDVCRDAITRGRGGQGVFAPLAVRCLCDRSLQRSILRGLLNMWTSDRSLLDGRAHRMMGRHGA